MALFASSSASPLAVSLPSLHRSIRRIATSLCMAGVCAAGVAAAQAPISLPNTITLYAGGGTTAAAGTVCAANPNLKSTDAANNGCPAVNGVFSTDGRGGLAVDGQGNVFVVDTNNNNLRIINGRTGIISAYAGGGTSCGAPNGQQDAYGDGCPYLQTGSFNHPRGIATDPYGNVLIAHYGGSTINIVCMAVSPLCPNVAGSKQVGSMYRIAGCVASNTASGSAISTTTDNVAASPYGNLAADGTPTYGACSAGVGGTNQPRGVSADKYGNVFIADTANNKYRVVVGPASYNGVTNPMAAVLALNTGASTYSGVTAANAVGKIYTLLGAFTPPATGATCAGPGGQKALDAKGDGCPFYQTTVGSGPQGIAVDSFGNVIFGDNGNTLLRVLYMGGAAMSNAITVNNAVTPIVGSVYVIAGTGINGTGSTAVPSKGITTNIDSNIFKVTVDPAGNIVIGDGNQVLFYDITTGYIRKLFATGTACAAKLDTYGDGCPAAQSVFSAGGAGLGVAYDTLGNLYLTDTESTMLVRKVDATTLVSDPVNTAFSQTLVLHGAPGTTNITAALAAASPDIALGTPTCGSINLDTTLDCTIPVTFTPTQPGVRSATLAATAIGVTGAATLPLAGVATGTALVADLAAPTTATLTTATAPRGAAADGSGNVYFVNTSTGNVIKYNVAGGTSTTVGTAPANPLQIAVDTDGNVYVTSTGVGTITKFTLATTGTYASSTITVGVSLPQGIAIDAANNLYIADKTTGSLFEVAAGTAQPIQTLATGFTNPVGVALDGTGNLFVADSSAPAVYKVANNANGLYTTTLYAAPTGAPTVTYAGLVPVAVAADSAGNVYVQDSTSKKVLSIPVSQTGPTTTTVLSGLTTPAGVAVDGTGAIYSADAAVGFTQIQRNTATYAFGTNTTTVAAATITNAGNISATGYQTAGVDSTEFPITGVSPSNCFATTAIIPGYACSVTTQFTPGSGTGAVSSTLAYTVAATTTGFLKFTGTKTGAAVTTTTTIGTLTPANPIYVASGTEVSFPVTVTASDSSTPTGTVNVTVDTLAPVAYALSGGTVTVALSGLPAGNHTVIAAYPSQTGLTGSTSTTVNFTIAKATTTTNWTPSATTQLYSAAIGTGVLDAAAVVTGTSTSVPGYYLYTATPNGSTTASTIHAATYLPIGTYALGVTFIPTDTTNFVGSTATVATYTVNKATTTAALGSTQMLVAADGTGNYTSVQTAVSALGATGGSVYIKPGTYTGNVLVTQPNVAIRGLGGDPTAVILTHSAGAFGSSSPGPQSYAGEFSGPATSGLQGSQLPSGSTAYIGDPGSATLLVEAGINRSIGTTSLTPNSFYAENFTVLNTYNTDTVTTTTTQVSGGVCTANAGTAQTYNYLFNNGLQCASQAIAISTQGDLGIYNNIYATSLQDTLQADSAGTSATARQYYFRGKYTGTVDYLFGNAAAVFDYASIYTVPHGANGNVTGSATIEAQQQTYQTGSNPALLSGYVANSSVFTSYIAGMTGFVFGRPYGPYSTWIMLNDYVDQVAPAGYIVFGSQNPLTNSTYAEFNDIAYTDPATGSADINGVIYTGLGGSSGQGLTGPRETASLNPGTPEAANSVKTSLTAAQATLYYPRAFLGQTVTGTPSGVTNWDHTAAIAAGANAFVPATSVTSVAATTPVTILMRPQTPGLGAVTNGTYTIPTGTYTLFDGSTQIATGSLDASGEATYTSSSLTTGVHTFTWTYSGDANFSGSTTATALSVTVNGTATTTTLTPATQNLVYGQSASVTATVASTGTAPTGSVSLFVDGATTPTATMTLTSSAASFTVTGLTAGNHSFTATYSGDTRDNASTATAVTAAVAKATLTVTGTGVNRIYNQPNSISFNVTGYQYTDTAATVFATGPTVSTTATQTSPAGTYSVVPAATLTTFGTNNYTLVLTNGSFTVTGYGQTVIFDPLPNFPSGGSYQLTARTSSGLAASYTVSGPATVSGATLTVTGTGTVTVTATSVVDPNGKYAAPTPVSRSFTAQ